MERRRRGWLVLVAAGVATFALVAPAQAGAAARHQTSAGASGDGGWLNSVACVNASDCWAAGTKTSQGGQNLAALVEHWNGSAWMAVPVPRPSGTESTVSQGGISCAGPAECWLVGSYVSRSGRIPYAERWNGSRWSVVRLPRPPHTSLPWLVAVSCPSAASCWAMGPSEAGPFTEHWNGQAWSAAHMGGIGVTDNLQTLTCASDRDCWAVGVRTAQTSGTVAVHWNGHRWSAVRTPTSDRRGTWLLGAGCSGRVCMAVGIGAREHVLALRWNGSAWQATRTPATPALLGGVACPNAAYCLAVGSGNGSAGLPVAQRWDGTRWHAQASPTPPGAATAGLTGIACVTAADCWAVGSEVRSITRPLIEHWDGRAWSIAGAG